MNVSPELDAQFRTAALAEGLVDVRYDVVASPVGDLLIAATDRGLARIHFDPDGQEEVLARIFGNRVLRAPIDEVRRELDEYFEGRRRDFDLPLDLRVVPFNAEVLGRAGAGSVRYDHHVRSACGKGRPAWRRARDRHRHEPKPDSDRPSLSPRDRRERLADRLRRRPRPQAAPAATRGRDSRRDAGRRRRRRVRRAARRARLAQGRRRGDARRPPELPPLPAAGVPGRNRGALGCRDRHAAATDPPAPAKRAGAARRGDRLRPRRPHGLTRLHRRAASGMRRSSTTGSSSPAGRRTRTSATTTGPSTHPS